jgi:hypothetical protein
MLPENGFERERLVMDLKRHGCDSWIGKGTASAVPIPAMGL